MPLAAIPAVVWAGAAAAGGTVASAAISAHSAGNAVQQEQQSANNALNLQSNIYNQTRSDYAPYRAIGTGALPNLAAYANHPVVMGGYGQGYQPGYQPGMTLGQMAQPGGAGSSAMGASGTIQMQAPNGQVKAVPLAQRAHFEALGAKVV